MILFLAIILAMVSIYLVLSAFQPLTEGEVMTVEEWERLEDETLNLLERRDLVFAEIRELEFESATNKVEGVEFEMMRRRYEDEAIEIMEQLKGAFDVYEQRIEQDIEALIEKAKLRKSAALPKTTPEAAAPAPTERTVSPQSVEDKKADQRPAASVKTCVDCGVSLAANSNFCDSCGARQEQTCGKCNTVNRFGARFCKSCGDNLEPSGDDT